MILSSNDLTGFKESVMNEFKKFPSLENTYQIKPIQIAEKLGFVGESGFVTFGLNNFIRIYHDATNKNVYFTFQFYVKCCFGTIG